MNSSFSIPQCSVDLDNSFGPYAGPCRGGFDFTLYFEDTILVIPLAVLLLVVAPCRVLFLRSRRTKDVKGGALLKTKLILTALVTVLQLTLIALWAATASYKSRASVASAVFSFLAYAALGLVSYFEHVYTIRPSFTITCFLFLAVLFDIARIRTLWLIGRDVSVAGVVSASFSLKVLLLVAESWEKTSLITKTDEAYSPEAISGSFNRWVFWWINQLMLLGYKTNVLMKDLFPVDDQMRSRLMQDRFQKEWKKADQSKYSLLWALVRTVKWPFIQGFFPRLCNIGFSFAQPLMINRAITLASMPADPMIKKQGYGMIGAYVIVYVGMAVSGGQYAHKLNRMAVMLRGAMVSGIYSKTLDLGVKEASPAAAITLMSTDVEVIAGSCSHLHETWANVVEIAIALYLLEQQLGVACIIPLIIGITTVVATSALAPKIGRTQVAWIAAIQERLSTTTSVLGSMKSIRLSGLTQKTFSVLHNLRVEEMEASKRLRRIMIGVILLTFVNPVLTPILSFMVFALVARSKDDTTLLAAKAFTALALFNLLIQPLNALLSSIPSIATAVACCGRVQEYLVLESSTDNRIHHEPIISGKATPTETETNSSSQTLNEAVVITEKKGLDFEHNTVAFSVDGGSVGWSDHNPLLRDVTFSIPKNSTTAIVGPVGCGKSTLLKGLLGELAFQYADLQASCSRIAYCDQTPWLPNRTVQQVIMGVSPLDKTWYKTVLSACALEEDISRWPEGDQCLVGSKGLTLSGGQKQRIALARAIYSREDTLILDDVLSGLDPETEDVVFNRLFGPQGILRLEKKTVILASSTNRRLPYTDYIVVVGEGSILEQGTYTQLKDQGGYVAGLSLADATWKANDEFDDEDDETQNSESSRRTSETGTDFITAAEEANRRTGDMTVYMYYFAAVGWIVFVGMLFLLSCFTVSSTMPEVWVNWWTAANSKHPNERVGYYLGVYASFGAISILSLTTACAVLFLFIIPKCGVHFHSVLSDTVAKAPMSLFWSTDTGVTLNRFSQDLQHVDMELPMAALLTAIAAFSCIAHLVLIGVTVKYIAAAFPILIALFYTLQRFYLRTSRQLRFLELESKSSVYAQFAESLSGLVTLRAFGWKTESQLESCGFLDESQKPYYLLFTIQRWLNMTVDLMIAGMATLLIALATQFRESISPGFLGIALLNIMSLNAALKLILTSWTSLETCIGSVLRIRTFAMQTGTEGKEDEDGQAPQSWPSHGRVEFRDVSAAYREGEDVLKNISLTIESGQKIGVCGRTGSGKSSFVLCLLRMVDMRSGSILIDDIDLSTLPREDIRSHLAAVPQDPYTFQGTVRENADPMETNGDPEIIDALIKCRIWNVLAANGGLEGSLNDIALSNGQKQLFCFARAMLRPSKIVVLDEAMSSVDAETDAMMETLIRNEFKDRTVIAVSHKLESMLDYDKVILLDKGDVVEFDTPDNLLSRDSAFKRLYTNSRDEVEI